GSLFSLDAARPAREASHAIIASVEKAPNLAVYRSTSAHAACVVGHGAGAGQKSAFMVRFANGLAARGVDTATFDFPYMATGRKVPDKAPVLEAAWFAAVAQAKTLFAPLPLF